MDLNRRLARISVPSRPVPEPSREPPCAAVETPHGRVHVAERFLEPDHCHGRIPIARVLLHDPELIAKVTLCPPVREIDMRRMLFLDTETTGLSGGAGTIPFLIGLAWFEDESLFVQQLFLSQPGQERPMLEMLSDRIRRSSCIITYNGKSFDWPLLSTRLVMNRVIAPCSIPHIDLLHSARRVYKRRLSGVRLVHLEEALFGMRREHDVEGYEIPSLYWSFVRSGVGAPLQPVLEHNENDLVALAALLTTLAEQFSSVRPGDDPSDLLGLAEIAARAGDEGRALSFAIAAADGGGPRDVTIGALHLASRIALRRGQVEGSCEMLLRAIGIAGIDALSSSRAHLRLSQIHERKTRDFARALAHAEHTMLAESADAHARRRSRISRRMQLVGKLRCGAQR